MTIDHPVARRLDGRTLAWRIGASASAAVGVVLLSCALTVNFTKVSYGFFSDGATYYNLAQSLANDGDFAYRRDDLVRVWRDFPSGPEGIFLMQEYAGAGGLGANARRPLGTFLHTLSCLQSLPVSLAEGGAGLGAIWGEREARTMLAEAGFGCVVAHALPHDRLHRHYVARKP